MNLYILKAFDFPLKFLTADSALFFFVALVYTGILELFPFLEIIGDA